MKCHYLKEVEATKSHNVASATVSPRRCVLCIHRIDRVRPIPLESQLDMGFPPVSNGYNGVIRCR